MHLTGSGVNMRWCLTEREQLEIDAGYLIWGWGR